MSTIALTGYTALIAGLVCPAVIAFLKREHWSPAVSHLVAASVATVAAAVGLVADGQIAHVHWSVAAFLTLAATVHGASQLVYALYFKGSALETVATHVPTEPSTDVTPSEPVAAAVADAANLLQ